jgi:hypothetical protein
MISSVVTPAILSVDVSSNFNININMNTNSNFDLIRVVRGIDTVCHSYNWYI